MNASVRSAGAPAGFLDIVCEDDELLRAEFDEIVATVLDGPHPPARAPLSPTEAQRRGPAGRRLSAATTALAARPRRPGSDGWARQRAPP